MARAKKKISDNPIANWVAGSVKSGKKRIAKSYKSGKRTLRK